MINPSSSTPEPREGESTVDKKDRAVASNHTTTLYLIPCRVVAENKTRFMPPFWCVKQGTRDEANMVCDELDVDAILTLMSSDEQKSQVRASVNNTAKFPIPVMTNCKALLQGTELVFAKDPVTEQPKKPQTNVKTWLAGASREYKSDQVKKRQGQ